jgi:hypothetical protein
MCPGIFNHKNMGDSMGDKSPKDKAKAQQKKTDDKTKADQKAKAERDAKSKTAPAKNK